MSTVLQDLGALSIYTGDAEHNETESAPYLVSLNDAGVVNEAASLYAFQALGSAKMIMALGSTSSVKSQLRRLSLVSIPDGVVSFRFFDPRVLRSFMNTILPKQLETVFGHVESYIVESIVSPILIEYFVDASCRAVRYRHISIGKV